MAQPVTYSRIVAPMTPETQVRSRLSWNGSDTTSIITAPLPYRGSMGIRRKPRFTNRRFKMET